MLWSLGEIARARSYLSYLARVVSRGTGTKVEFYRQLSEVRMVLGTKVVLSVKVLLRDRGTVSGVHVERAVRSARRCGAKLVAIVAQKPLSSAFEASKRLGVKLVTIRRRGIELTKSVLTTLRAMLLEIILPLIRSSKVMEIVVEIARRIRRVEEAEVKRVREGRLRRKKRFT